jgi:WD40 repeat protein
MSVFQEFEFKGRAQSLSFSADGKTLAVGASCPNSLMVWNLNEATPLTLYRSWIPFSINETTIIAWVGFPFPDGTTLLTCYGGGRTLGYWNATTGKRVGEFHFSEGDPWGFWIGPEGRIIVKALWWLHFPEDAPVDDMGNPVGVGVVIYERAADNPHRWELRHYNESKRFHDKEAPSGWHRQGIDAVQVGPEDRIVSVSLREKTIKFWNAETGEVDATVALEYELPSVRYAKCCPAFSPDLSALGIPARNSATVCDVATGRVRVTLPPFAENINAMAFSLDSCLLAISEYNQTTVSLWDIQTGGRRTLLEGKTGEIRSLAFSPDGQLLAVGGKKFITIWDINR